MVVNKLENEKTRVTYRLKASLIKKLKIKALETDARETSIIEEALEMYFSKNPLDLNRLQKCV